MIAWKTKKKKHFRMQIKTNELPAIFNQDTTFRFAPFSLVNRIDIPFNAIQ